MLKQKKNKKKIKSGDVITIDVLRNGVRQRIGEKNDYVVTQLSSKTFRIKIL